MLEILVINRIIAALLYAPWKRKLAVFSGYREGLVAWVSDIKFLLLLFLFLWAWWRNLQRKENSMQQLISWDNEELVLFSFILLLNITLILVG